MRKKNLIKSAGRIKQHNRGMTLIELLVAMSICSVILTMTMSVIVTHRELYQKDLIKTRISQDIRGAMDLLGADIKQAGERLPRNFPAIELINNTDDELILRQNLIDEVIIVCENLIVGQAINSVTVSISGSTTLGCATGEQSSELSVWEGHREAEGGAIPVYIYNESTRQGEFINYSSLLDSGTSVSLVLSDSHVLQNDYVAGASVMYVLKELHYSVLSDPIGEKILKLTINNDNTLIQNVVYGIQLFDISITMNDSTNLTSFSKNDTWPNIQNIALTIKGIEKRKTQTISRELTSKFFPRNVLSQ